MILFLALLIALTVSLGLNALWMVRGFRGPRVVGLRLAIYGLVCAIFIALAIGFRGTDLGLIAIVVPSLVVSVDQLLGQIRAERAARKQKGAASL